MRNVTLLLMLLLCVSCTTYTTRPNNSPPEGESTKYKDPADPDPGGLRVESADIMKASDQMVRDILSTEEVAGMSKAPDVAIDSKYFSNRSSSTLDKNIITNRLRVRLQNAAGDRIRFIARHGADLLEQERKIQNKDQQPNEVDFRIQGEINDLNKRNSETGRKSIYTQLHFELVDIDSGRIVWSDMYEFKKSGVEDVIYR